jgi:hypothetical protein
MNRPAANSTLTAAADPQVDPDIKPITVTVAKAQKISGLGRTTIWNLIKAGRLERRRIGRRTLIVYRSLEALLLTSA